MSSLLNTYILKKKKNPLFSFFECHYGLIRIGYEFVEGKVFSLHHREVVARAVYSSLQDYGHVEKEVELYRENNMEVVMNLHYIEAQK